MFFRSWSIFSFFFSASCKLFCIESTRGFRPDKDIIMACITPRFTTTKMQAYLERSMSCCSYFDCCYSVPLLPSQAHYSDSSVQQLVGAGFCPLCSRSINLCHLLMFPEQLRCIDVHALTVPPEPQQQLHWLSQLQSRLPARCL